MSHLEMFQTQQVPWINGATRKNVPYPIQIQEWDNHLDSPLTTEVASIAEEQGQPNATKQRKMPKQQLKMHGLRPAKYNAKQVAIGTLNLQNVSQLKILTFLLQMPTLPCAKKAAQVVKT